jgi:polysaccharide export outer membrane protein
MMEHEGPSLSLYRSVLFASVAICIVISGCAATQHDRPFDKLPPAAADNSPTLTPASLQTLQQFESAPMSGYELGPGDVVDVTVWAHPELSGKHTVGPDGRIQVPFVGSLKISEMTSDQASEFVTRALSDDYLNSAATVQIEEYTDNQILVLGHVPQPGIVRFADQPTLLEALARATGTSGGAAASGGNGGSVISPTRCAIFRGSDRVAWIDLRPLMRGEDMPLNIRLKRNDVLYIPDPSDQLIYVMGQVNKPGAYPLTPDMSFLEALASAGGPTDAAQPGEIILARPDLHVQQTVDLDDYINGKDVRNYKLARGDIVYVPKNGVAKVGWVLQQLNPITTTAVFGAALF